MTVLFTADPRKATRQIHARPEGEKLTRNLAFDGSALETKPGSYLETMTVSAVIATAKPVQRRDSKGPYLEVLAMSGCRLEKGEVSVVRTFGATGMEI